MIPEHILKLVKKESYPPQHIGGQSCGMMSRGIKLTCEELGFSITVDHHRSQLKNYETAIALFELYYFEITPKE